MTHQIAHLPLRLALALFAGACAQGVAEQVTPESPVGPTPPPTAAPPAPPTGSGFSQAATAWAPGPNDTCTQPDHLQYTSVGPDGKLYPTWHPPTGPGGCTFGHEHGRDPSGSALHDMGPVLFGYVNEQLDRFPGRLPRHEDHVGHKVEWGNALVFRPKNPTGPASDLVCDALTKFHQGTHSPDAFANNLHEMVKRLRCSDGTTLDLNFLVANGPAGQLSVGCDKAITMEVGMPNPADSPRSSHPRAPGRSMGNRFIPDRLCFETSERNPFSEVWRTQNLITTADDRVLVRFAEYFFVRNPARFHDAQASSRLARSVEACFTQGFMNIYLATDSYCKTARANANDGPPAWDSPASPFDGTDRSVRFNDFVMLNATGDSVWYTDPFGGKARTTPFAGAVRQLVSTTNHSHVQNFGGGVVVSGSFRGHGVHAPN